MAAGIFYYSSPSAPQNSDFSTDLAAAPTLASTSPEALAREVPEGWKEYTSSRYRFSLFYPQGLAVQSFNEGGGAQTVTFQNTTTVEGFQIFIVPYTEPQVTDERFKQDVPSGVRKELTNITIDGATGAAFYSTNTLLGETREVWFVHGGYLYEVTTLKPLGSWLDDILGTWRFGN